MSLPTGGLSLPTGRQNSHRPPVGTWFLCNGTKRKILESLCIQSKKARLCNTAVSVEIAPIWDMCTSNVANQLSHTDWFPRDTVHLRFVDLLYGCGTGLDWTATGCVFSWSGLWLVFLLPIFVCLVVSHPSLTSVWSWHALYHCIHTSRVLMRFF